MVFQNGNQLQVKNLKLNLIKFINFVCLGVSGPYLHIDTDCTISQDFLDEFSISVDDERRRKAALDTCFGKINQSTKSKDII